MTTTPRRIQRKMTTGWSKPPGAIYVGRPTRFGNPYRLVRQDNGWAVQYGTEGATVGTFPTDLDARRYAVDAYRTWINQPEQKELRDLARQLLHGRDLMCWCETAEPGQPDHCHATVLLALVARTPAARGAKAQHN